MSASERRQLEDALDFAPVAVEEGLERPELAAERLELRNRREPVREVLLEKPVRLAGHLAVPSRELALRGGVCIGTEGTTQDRRLTGDAAQLAHVRRAAVAGNVLEDVHARDRVEGVV